MSENKLLTRLKSYLDLSSKHRKKKSDELKIIIRKIRKKEKALIIECRNTKSKQQKTLQKRIAILHAQRKKGLKALKKIKQK